MVSKAISSLQIFSEGLNFEVFSVAASDEASLTFVWTFHSLHSGCWYLEQADLSCSSKGKQ